MQSYINNMLDIIFSEGQQQVGHLLKFFWRPLLRPSFVFIPLQSTNRKRDSSDHISNWFAAPCATDQPRYDKFRHTGSAIMTAQLCIDAVQSNYWPTKEWPIQAQWELHSDCIIVYICRSNHRPTKIQPIQSHWELHSNCIVVYGCKSNHRLTKERPIQAHWELHSDCIVVYGCSSKQPLSN